ncbi:hypothetical protein BDF22DRAFT_668825 [Syncephalis plumigaleata]|nr:hypothetical protein BDF22DRAFT_668825 [Syncephalis plumigaleata]
MTTTIQADMANSQLQDSVFPVKVRQHTEMVNDQQTELVLMEFSNRLLLIVTQLGKLGGMLQCNLSEIKARSAANEFEQLSLSDTTGGQTTGETSSEACSPWIVHPIFGVSLEQQALYTLYTTQLAQILVEQHPYEQRPLLISIALKSGDKNETMQQQRASLRQIEDMLRQLLAK